MYCTCTLLSFPGHDVIHWVVSGKPRSSNNISAVSIKNCVIKQQALFDINGHLTFTNCNFEGLGFHAYLQLTFHLHRSKDSKQIESSPMEPKKELKMIRCEADNVQIYFSITEAAVQVDIIKCDLPNTPVVFEIGNETQIVQSASFVNVTIVECNHSERSLVIKAFKHKSVAVIQLIDTIMNYFHIHEDEAHGGSTAYIIENCTFTNVQYPGLRSYDAKYVRITNSQFIISEDNSHCSKGGCVINVKPRRGQYSDILNEIFNPSCKLLCTYVYVDNSEFVGSTGTKPGGVIQIEYIALKITNSVFRLTEHSNPPQTGGILSIAHGFSFDADNVTFDAGKLTGGNRVSIISTKLRTITDNGTPIRFTDTEILCPEGMMTDETLKDKNGFRHHTCLPACSHGKYTYQSGTVILSGNSKEWRKDTSSLVKKEKLPICHPCPVGANCSERVSALPNYWGYVENNAISIMRCPDGYCCQESNRCNTLNSCNKHRSGILCSTCENNWTESLISENCVSIEGCNSKLTIGLYILVVTGYSFGLITFNTLKDQIFKILKLLYQKIRNRLFRKTGDFHPLDESKDQDLENREKAEDNDTMKYVHILLYYVQDASLFKIALPGVDKKEETVIVQILKFSPDIVSNLYSHMGNLCFGSGTTPVTKIIFKSMLGPCIMLFLLLTCGIQTIMSKYIFSHSSFRKSFQVCLIRAFLLSVLFSYQQLLVAAFTLIQCVEIYGKMVLFLQSNIRCFSMWQQFIQVFLYINILPTFLVLSHASFYVAENKMSNNTHFNMSISNSYYYHLPFG